MGDLYTPPMDTITRAIASKATEPHTFTVDLILSITSWTVNQVSGQLQERQRLQQLKALKKESSQTKATAKKLLRTLGKEKEALQTAQALFDQSQRYQEQGLLEKEEKRNTLAARLIQYNAGSPKLSADIGKYFYNRADYLLIQAPLEDKHITHALKCLLRILDIEGSTEELRQKTFLKIEHCVSLYIGSKQNTAPVNIKKGIALNILLKNPNEQQRISRIGLLAGLPWERFYNDICIIEDHFYNKFIKALSGHQASTTG